MTSIGPNVNSAISANMKMLNELKNGGKVTPETAAAAKAARGQYLGPAIDLTKVTKIGDLPLDFWQGLNNLQRNNGNVTVNIYNGNTTNNTINGNGNTLVGGDNKGHIDTFSDQSETITNYNQHGYGHHDYLCHNPYWRNSWTPIHTYPPVYIGAPPMPVPLPPGAYMPPDAGVKPLPADVVPVGDYPPSLPPEAVDPGRTGGIKPVAMAFADVAPVEDAKTAEEKLAMEEAASTDMT